MDKKELYEQLEKMRKVSERIKEEKHWLNRDTLGEFPLLLEEKIGYLENIVKGLLGKYEDLNIKDISVDEKGKDIIGRISDSKNNFKMKFNYTPNAVLLGRKEYYELKTDFSNYMHYYVIANFDTTLGLKIREVDTENYLTVAIEEK